MTNQRVSNMALGAATCRLIEQFQPEKIRLFRDSVLKDLIGTPIRTLMQFKSLRCSIIPLTISSEPDSRRWECRISNKLSAAGGTQTGGVRM